MSDPSSLHLRLVLVASHRSLVRGPNQPWLINTTIYVQSQLTHRPNWTIEEFKTDFGRLFSPILTAEEQHFYVNHLTLEEVKGIEKVSDEKKMRSLPNIDEVAHLSVVIKPQHLGQTFMKNKLPHLDLTHLQQLLTQLESIPIEQLDVGSVHESSLATPHSNLVGVTIRTSYGIILNEVMIDGQVFLPYQVDEKIKLEKLRSKYSYSAASEEYVKEVNQANEKYESDLAHCKKLLHELPVALANSQIKLVEDAEGVCEKMAGMELSDLGALVVEQTVLAKQIKTQQERLLQLKPIPFDKSKFILHEFQSEINLSFGWHKFGDILYELIHTPMPTVAEVNSLLQPNQHPISVKRTRQRFEAAAN